MSTYTSLSELEDAHDEITRAARRHIDDAEEHLDYYRSQITRMQETFHAHATHRQISDHPGFRAGLQRVSEEADEHVRETGRVIADLEENLQALTTQLNAEREDFIEQQRHA